MGKLKGNLLLLLTAMIWGSAFVAQSIGSESVGAFTFNASRSIIAGIFLIPCIMLLDKINHKEKTQTALPKRSRKKLILGGVACGVALCVASALQQIGISYTTVGKAGFLTAMYIIFVPLMGTIFRKKIHPIVFFAVALSATGLYLLCMTEGFSISKGDICVLLCAVCFAAHIMIIEYFTKDTDIDAVRMSCIQFFVAGIISLVPMFIFEKPDLGAILSSALPILYAGVFSSGVAYTLQIIGQKYVSSTAASLIMSMESVFAVISGWLILHEKMSLRETLGCVLVFCAVIIAQTPDMFQKKDKLKT